MPLPRSFDHRLELIHTLAIRKQKTELTVKFIFFSEITKEKHIFLFHIIDILRNNGYNDYILISRR